MYMPNNYAMVERAQSYTYSGDGDRGLTSPRKACWTRFSPENDDKITRYLYDSGLYEFQIYREWRFITGVVFSLTLRLCRGLRGVGNVEIIII